jgi:SAM-dependent methyltransferase
MGWSQVCDRFFWWTQRRILPELRNSQYAYASALREAVDNSSRWLDLGCGHNFLPPWLNKELGALDLTRCKFFGVDGDATALVRHPQRRQVVRGNIEALPFSSQSFDLVTANMVVEHLEHPETFFAEVARVLRPGGRVLLHTPNADGYTTRLTQLVPERWRAWSATLLQGREEVDVYPTHYRANSLSQIEAIATRTGLVLTRGDLLLTSPQLIAVPPLLVVEMLFLRALKSRWASMRPCLLLTLTNAPASASPTRVTR